MKIYITYQYDWDFSENKLVTTDKEEALREKAKIEAKDDYAAIEIWEDGKILDDEI